jgi:Domain of unknown function (DUF1877)
MGMRGHIRQITPSELGEFQKNPKTIRKTIQGKARRNTAATMATLDRLKPMAEELRSRNLSPEEQAKAREEMLKELSAVGAGFGIGPNEDGLNLEKSWHVLHYLLTGEAEEAPPPLGNAILGGKEIGDDLGYGPARFLTPQQVREVASALASMKKEDLASRFDLDAMIKAQIYPVRDESELELAQEYFDDLSRYYADAAVAGNAMLLYVV